MTWSGRAFAWFNFSALAGTVLLLAMGCAATVPPDKLPQSTDTPFKLQTDDVESAVGARTSRSQVPDPPPTGASSLPAIPPPPTGALAAPTPLPPQTNQTAQPLPDLPPTKTAQGVTPAPGSSTLPTPPAPPANPTLPDAPPSSGIRQVSMVAPAKMRLGVSVRAWVNGKPIFDDEIQCSIPREMLLEIAKQAPDQREAELLKLFRQIAESLVDQELLVQEMMHKIEATKQTKVLDKFQAAAKKEVQKRIAAQVRQLHLNSVQEFEEKLAESGTSLASIKRVIERQFLSEIYVHNRVEAAMSKVGNDDIREYYDAHVNQFATPDKVKWQNIFIAVGPKHPTLADARQFAEQVMAHWRGGEDVSKLLEFDDGESQSRKGTGAGELRGDIRPRDLEPLLFAMKDGEFGPLYELPTGVHLYHLLHREYAGVMPLDEKLQTRIGILLKNEIFDKERKQLIHDLRQQAGDGVVILDRPLGQ